MIKVNIDIPYTNITNFLVVFGNMENDENTYSGVMIKHIEKFKSETKNV